MRIEYMLEGPWGNQLRAETVIWEQQDQHEVVKSPDTAEKKYRNKAWRAEENQWMDVD